jgi:pimeloyl-ACP methyl ester carboxylesterase
MASMIPNEGGVEMIHLQTIGGRRIACWVNGGGFVPGRRTLAFVHSSGFDHTNWIRQYTPLKEGYNIVALDLHGHGRSEGPGEREIGAYVAWVRRILGEIGVVRPVLVGHSLGAAICLSFAIRHPGTAAAVVPVGGGARMPVNPLILEGLREDPAAVIALAARLSVAKANRERLASLLEETLSGIDPAVLYDDLSACNGMDITEKVAGIEIPTLVICGAEDKMTPPALAGFLRDRIAGARLVLIEQAGHFAMLENPEAFNRALTDFVEALP